MAAKKSNKKDNSQQEVVSDNGSLVKQFIELIMKNKNIHVQFGDKMANALYVPSGIYTIDAMLEHGGIPVGIMMHIWGKHSSLKSHAAYTIANSVLSNASIQEKYVTPMCCTIDLERSFAPDWYAKSIGISPEKFIVITSLSAEHSLDVAASNIESGLIPVTIIDSVSNLLPDAEREADMSDQAPGRQGRLMSKFCRKVMGIMSDNPNTILIMVNQVREGIGVMYGDPEKPTGGRAIGFNAHLDIRMNNISVQEDWLKKSNYTADAASSVRIYKSKGRCGKRYRDAQAIFWKDGYGILKGADIMNAAGIIGIMKSVGGWVYLNGEKVYQGRSNLGLTIEQFFTDPSKLDAADRDAARLVVNAVERSLQARRDGMMSSSTANDNLFTEADLVEDAEGDIEGTDEVMAEE